MNLKEFAINNVKRNMKSYLGYFFSIIISSALLFSFTMFINHPNLNISEFPPYLKIALKTSENIAYIFLFLFLLYSVSVFLKSRYKEFGILYTIGMSKKQIQKMIFFENIIINTGSSFIGVIIGLIFSKLFLLGSSRLLGLEPLKFYIPIKAMGYTIVYFIILAILISIFTSFIVKENQVLKLLKQTKKPKKEPIASPILAILCLMLFIIAYYKAFTVTELTIVNRIVPVTSMVIIATYLLFSQLSTFIIKSLKKNNEFYKKRTNMLWISNLSYKIKDNTRMFFLISITSAVAFTAIGSVYSFWKDVNRQVEESYPQAIHYATYRQYYSSDKPDMKEKDEERINYLEHSLQNESIKYSRIDGQIKTILTEKSHLSTRLIKESKYIELIKELDIKPIKFNKNESISLSLIEKRKEKDTVLVGNKKFKVINQVDKSIMPAFYNNIYVVKDDFYNNIKENYIDEFTNFNVSNYKDTLNLCKNFDEKFGDESRVQPYMFLSKAYMLQMGKIIYSTVLFLAVFIGLIFFITTSSFLYNKIYMDCQEDKNKYKQLNKIGLTYTEIKKIATIDIGILFLLPYLVAVIHSIFALMALKNSMDIEVVSSAFLVMGSFFVIQIIYFIIIKKNYLKEIKENLII